MKSSIDSLARSSRAHGRLLAGALGAVLLTLVFSGEAAAQGFALGPPRGAFGPGPGDAVRGGPGDSDDPASRAAGLDQIFIDDSSWQRWWTFNRDPYLLRLQMPGVVPILPAPLSAVWAPPVNPSRPAEDDVYTTVVPALLELLERHGRDNDVRGAVLLALAKIGPPRSGAHPELAEKLAVTFQGALADRTEMVRDLAVVAYGVQGGAHEAELLAEIAGGAREARRLVGGGSIDRRTRAFAVYGLADIGFDAHHGVVRAFVVRVLSDLLSAERADPEIATAAIIGLGLTPLPYHAEALDSGDAPGRTRVVDRLLAEFDHGEIDRRARVEIPVALARLLAAPHGSGADPAEVAAVREGQRVRVVERLLRELVGAVDGSKGPAVVRQGALQALGLLVRAPDPDAEQADLDRRALKALLTMAEAGQEREAGLAMVALARIAVHAYDAAPGEAETIVGRLVKLVSVGEPSARPWAALALAVLSGELPATHPLLAPRLAVTSTLRKRFSEAPSPEERTAVAMALGLVGDREGSTKGIVDLLDEGDFHIRGLFATSLALMGARDAIEPMREIALEPIYRPYLLRDIATALTLLADPYVADILVAKLGVARFMPERIAALQALAWSNDERAIGTLLDVMRAGRYRGRKVDQTTRAFAAAALGALCARDPVPWNTKFALDVTWSGAPSSLTDRGYGGGVLDLF